MSCLFPKLLAITVCFCCPAVFAFSQCPDSSSLNITATLYTQENGLATNMLAGIAKDSTGYRYFLGVDGKWIRYNGVNFGLKSYDRFSFTHYRLKVFEADRYTDQFIGTTHYKYEEGEKGIPYKWAITNDSLTWIDVHENKSGAFQLPKEVDPNQGVDFFPDGKNCWLTTPDKVFRFDVRSKKFIAISLQGISEINLSGRMPLYIFSRTDGTPYLLVRNTIFKLDSISDSFIKLCNFSPRTVVVAAHDIVMDKYFFIAESNILYEINLDNGSVKESDLGSYTDIKNSSALKITSLRSYHDRLLIGTSNAGLFIFNRYTNSMQHFQYEKQNSDGNLTNAVVWFAVDDENVVWMQTEAGLIKLEVNNQRIKTYLPSSVKAGELCNNCNNVRAIYTYDSSNLLIGSFGGVYNFNLNSGQFSKLISPVDKHPVWNNIPVSAVTGDDNENIFIGSWGNEGILLLNSKKKKLVNILQAKNKPEFSYSFFTMHVL